METAFLLLGGNVGDREKCINDAITLINREAGTVTQASALYETEPWGMQKADKFLNIAIELSTKLSALELLDVLLNIEKQLGRERNPLIKEYESRPIDIDILFYGTEIIQTPRLTIPHPQLQARKFVLVPLCDIAPEFIHPILQKSIMTLLNECQDKLETVALKPYTL
ncbi:MAG: 2-amino-4-hydroxy-6-hydroxymethyldihydropteridine diphosphokinase [Bacteroidota bacterium]|nr:2-amino-4-hydroxy-6-hydroxymethyldihydropteridine diphosphokinase [Bacteroidota bacterium]